MAKLTHRQKQALILLAIANVAALSALGWFLLREPSSPGNGLTASPLSPQHLKTCRQKISQALLQAGQSGLVQTRENGRIQIHLQRPLVTDSLRLDADAAIWTALESIPNRGDCLAFDTVQVSVDIVPLPLDDSCSIGQCRTLRATARVSVPDLMQWSLGKIDDAELSLRLEYQPPLTPTPIFLTAPPAP